MPELPDELWQMIFERGAPLRLARYLRLCPRDLAARRLQAAYRLARRVRPPWREGERVRVFRPRRGEWVSGELVVLPALAPPHGWAVSVLYRDERPSLLIFLDPARPPPLRAAAS